MNIAWQYLPGFVDGDPEMAPFTTQEELLAKQWIHRWTKNPKFVKFVIKKLNPNMTQYGAEWMLLADIPDTTQTPWLIAFLKTNEGLTFELVEELK